MKVSYKGYTLKGHVIMISLHLDILRRVFSSYFYIFVYIVYSFSRFVYT